MVKTLIIDDEVKAKNLLYILLKREFGEKLHIETALGAEEGLAKIENFKPELVFLDIEMPVMNSFELLSKVSYKNFKVIFTTAYNQYAIKAIKFNALDYLLKPINSAEVSEAVNKYLSRSNGENREAYPQQLDNFLSRKEKFLVVPTQEGMKFIEIDSIIRCEAVGNYTRFILTENSTFLSSKTLKEFEDTLTQHAQFLRAHRSHLININFVVGYKNEGSVIFKDNTCVPVSRRRKADIIKALELQK